MLDALWESVKEKLGFYFLLFPLLVSVIYIFVVGHISGFDLHFLPSLSQAVYFFCEAAVVRLRENMVFLSLGFVLVITMEDIFTRFCISKNPVEKYISWYGRACLVSLFVKFLILGYAIFELAVVLFAWGALIRSFTGNVKMVEVNSVLMDGFQKIDAAGGGDLDSHKCLKKSSKNLFLASQVGVGMIVLIIYFIVFGVGSKASLASERFRGVWAFSTPKAKVAERVLWREGGTIWWLKCGGRGEIHEVESSGRTVLIQTLSPARFAVFCPSPKTPEK